MRSHFLIAAAASAALLATVACTTMGNDPTTYVDTLDVGYAAFCAADKSNSACSSADRKKEQAAKQAALDGIAAYEGGTITQAQEQALVNDVAALIRDFESKK